MKKALLASVLGLTVTACASNDPALNEALRLALTEEAIIVCEETGMSSEDCRRRVALGSVLTQMVMYRALEE